MNESVNDWIKRVVVSLHYPATKETSNHQLSWNLYLTFNQSRRAYFAMSACDIVYGLYSTHILRQYLHIPKKNRRNRIPASVFEGRNNTPFLRVYEQQVCSFFKIFSPAVYQKPCYLWSFDNTTKYPSAFSKSGDH